MCFLLLPHRYEIAGKIFRFLFGTSQTSTLGAWEGKSRAFRKKPCTCSPTMHGLAMFGSCRTLWSELCCCLPAHHCECRWLKFLLAQTSARLVIATFLCKPSESISCEHSSKAIGLSEVLGERQLVWASRDNHWPTRYRS